MNPPVVPSAVRPPFVPQAAVPAPAGAGKESAMPAVPIDPASAKATEAEPMTISLDGVFDGASAWELRHTLEAMQKRQGQVVLDFSRVREFYDFGVAVLAHGLAQRREQTKIALKGLRTHQLRMFRYFGVDTE